MRAGDRLIIMCGICGILSVVPAVLMLICGGVDLFKSCHIAVQTQVVSVAPRSEYGRCIVLVRYVSTDGVDREVELDMLCSSATGNQSTSTVTACYNTIHPDKLHIESDRINNIVPYKTGLIVFIIGSVFLGIFVLTIGKLIVEFCIFKSMYDAENALALGTEIPQNTKVIQL